MLLSGRKVVVTGAASGIGKAVAERAVREGAIVAGWDLSAFEIEGVLSIRCDVEDDADVQKAHAQTRDALGYPDVLVNSVGATSVAGWHDTTPEDWARALSVNLTSAWSCSRALLPWMVASGRGSIVNVTSVHARGTVEGHLPYAAAKAGLEALTRGLAVEVGRSGVRVNAVAPGWVDTPRVAAYLDERPRLRERVEQLHPLGRIGTAIEVAAAVVFVASDECPFIHGAVLTADGGLSARLASVDATEVA